MSSAALFDSPRGGINAFCILHGSIIGLPIINRTYKRYTKNNVQINCIDNYLVGAESEIEVFDICKTRPSCPIHSRPIPSNTF